MTALLGEVACDQWTHGELKEKLTARSRELMRLLCQDHLELRAAREKRPESVAGSDGVVRRHVEGAHRRALTCLFGTVTVQRLAYRAKGEANVYPMDTALNLPRERHSHGLRRLAAMESVRGSFADAAAAAMKRACGVGVGKYFLVMPVGRGRVYWGLGAHADRPAARYDELAEVRRRVHDWHDPIPRLLDVAPSEAVLHHDITDLDPLDSYVRGRVVLLGDAAHAMHPDMAQGAAQSLEDAVVLAAALAEASDIPAALVCYDEQRRPRTQTIVKQARIKGLHIGQRRELPPADACSAHGSVVALARSGRPNPRPRVGLDAAAASPLSGPHRKSFGGYAASSSTAG